MNYTLIILPKAQKYLDKLDKDEIKNIGASVEELKKNPYIRRALVDIKKLKGFKSPPMYRMRVGRHRLQYFVDEGEKTIYLTSAFLRSGDSDYR